MTTRNVTDCNRCGQEDVKDSRRIEVLTPDGKKRVDLCSSCLGIELQNCLAPGSINPIDAGAWYDRVNKTPKRTRTPKEPEAEMSA